MRSDSNEGPKLVKEGREAERDKEKGVRCIDCQPWCGSAWSCWNQGCWAGEADGGESEGCLVRVQLLVVRGSNAAIILGWE